jgi:hypothetical protein
MFSTKKGFGCEVLCPLSSKYFRFVGYAFVDDTDIIQSVLQEDPEATRKQLQEAIGTWEFSLKATCGALVPEKTVWWLVSFCWSGSSWRYAGVQDYPGDLYVNDIHNNRKVIKCLEPNQAYETLGVFLAPDGNLDEQFQKMLNAATKWADNLRTGAISKNDVWLAIHSTILRTLMYPLPAIRLSKAQWETIMSPILQYCLPALGICRNFPRKLVHSTLDYMGLDIKHLFFLQEISRLKDIILHNFNDTLTGKLYHTSMEIFFLEMGINPSNLSSKDKAIALTTPSLVQSTMTFLVQHHLVLRHSITMRPLRINDEFIMEAFISLDIDETDLGICNTCRLYLKVCFLSEITTGDGTYITEDAWTGRYLEQPFKDKSWPKYRRPSAASWHTWQKWVSKTFLTRGRCLRHPLGPWLLWDNQ